MHYKTIVLEFMQKQLPALHERLRRRKQLLRTVNATAAELKRRHDYWMAEVRSLRPDSDPIQVSSEALELALKDMQENLRQEFAVDETPPP